MKTTNYFKFNKPEKSDHIDINDLNENFDVIDQSLLAGLYEKELTSNTMGSSTVSEREYAWAPFFEITNGNEFDVAVTDRNYSGDLPEATITIEAGKTFRRYISGRYYMNFYVQDQHDVTFRWYVNAQKVIDALEARVSELEAAAE